MTYDLILALLAAGTIVVVIATLAALAARGVHNRLHLLTPVTSLGAPLTGLALAIDAGWTLTTAEILFVVFLLAATGPVMGAAAARMAGQREGSVRRESPQ